MIDRILGWLGRKWWFWRIMGWIFDVKVWSGKLRLGRN